MAYMYNICDPLDRYRHSICSIPFDRFFSSLSHLYPRVHSNDIGEVRSNISTALICVNFFYNVSLGRDFISLLFLLADYLLDNEIYLKLFEPIIELTSVILNVLVQFIFNASFIFRSLSHPQPR